MIALLDADLVGNDTMFFEIVEPITVETIVSDDTLASQTLVYSKGSKIEGIPAMVKLTSPLSGNSEIIEGILVEKDGGHLVFPYQNVKEVAGDILHSISNGIEKAESTLKKDGDKETVLGFTYKQLLFIGLITVVVAKIVKN